jgi:3-oxoacyl-[acyl-carrier protein] reductase
MSFKTILVAGASRGIGLAVAEHLSSQCDRVLAVSRTKAPVGEWIQADLSVLAGMETAARQCLWSSGGWCYFD